MPARTAALRDKEQRYALAQQSQCLGGAKAGYCQTVSVENVEIAQRLWEAWNRRDRDGVFSLYDPDIECISRVAFHSEETYRGHEGVRRFFVDAFMSSFDDFSARAEQFIEAGENVVVHVKMGGRDKTTGVYVEQPLWQVYKFRKGLVARIGVYTERAEALEAAGPRE